MLPASLLTSIHFLECAHQLGATSVAFCVFVNYVHYGLKVSLLKDTVSFMSSAMQKSQKPDHATLQNLVALVTVMRLQRLLPLSSSLLTKCTFAGALAHPRMRLPKAHPALLLLLPGFRLLAGTPHGPGQMAQAACTMADERTELPLPAWCVCALAPALLEGERDASCVRKGDNASKTALTVARCSTR